MNAHSIFSASRLGLALASCLALLFLSSGAGAQGHGYGEVNYGGVNLNAYCNRTFGVEFASVLIGATAGDWVCSRTPHDRRPISVETACRQQYGKNDLKARALNWNDPLSWRCFGPREVRDHRQPPRAFEPDTDRKGGDYTSVTLPAGSAPNACQSLCAADPGRCKSWTYVRAGVQAANPRCWLKNTVPSAIASKCCHSGVIGGR